MTHTLKYKCAFAILLATNFAIAQPDPDNMPGELNPTDAPLDQNWLLMLVIAMIVGLVIVNIKKSANNVAQRP